MKKLLALLLVLTMCMALFACGNKADEPKVTEDGGVTDTPESTENSDPIELPEITEIEVTESDVTENDVTESEASATQSETAPQEPTTEAQISPLLYKVTDKDGNVIWLFGSIHVGYDYFYPLPSYVMDAFNSSDAVAFEIDLIEANNDLGKQLNMAMALMYKDGTTIKDHLSEEVYQDAVKILEENNMYSQLLDRYKPIMWMSAIDQFLYTKSGMDCNLGIDMTLLTLAKEQGKTVLEVESFEYQTDMMANFSDELQAILLESSVESYKNSEDSIKDLKEMVDAWASGDEALFGSIINEEVEIEDEEVVALYEEYANEMLVIRNANMTEYAEMALGSGKEVFICVGAAHIVGKGAMAEQLRERGYTVEIVK